MDNLLSFFYNKEILLRKSNNIFHYKKNDRRLTEMLPIKDAIWISISTNLAESCLSYCKASSLVIENAFGF